jgi:hypothetical protein
MPTSVLPVSRSFQPTAMAPLALSVAASGAATVADDPPKWTSGVLSLVPTW